MQRWGVLLSAYHYNIEFKPTKSHANADGLSHLPVPDNAAVGNPQDVTLFNVSQIVSLPVTEVHIQAATRKDPVLGAVLRYTQQGWPSQVPEHLRLYWLRRNELSMEREILLWGIFLSRGTEFPCSCPTSPLGLAHKTLGTSTS